MTGSALTRVERLLALRSFPGFARVSSRELTGLAAYSCDRRLEAGEVLFRQGEQVARLVFVVHGEVELWRDGRLFRTLGSKSVVGGLSGFAREAIRYDVVVSEGGLGLEITLQDMHDIYEDNFHLLHAAVVALSGNMIGARRALGTTAGFSNEIAEAGDLPTDRSLDLVEKLAALYRSMTFANAHLESLADLAREAVEVRAPAGTTLWVEGDPSGHMLVILGGVVECSTSDGQRFVLGPRDAVGTMEGTAGAPRWFSAVVQQDLVALRIDYETFFDVLEDNFEMAFDMLSTLAAGTLYLNELVAGESPESAEALADSLAPVSPGRPAPGPE